MPAHASDDADAAEDDTACTSCGGDSSLRIDFSAAAALKCNFCGHKANEETPLVSMTTVASTGGKWPWAKYRAIKDDEGAIVSRRPTGKYCGICRNTFNALGLEQAQSTIAKFYTFVSRPENAHQSRHFISCVADWISAHNEDPDRTRLLNSKEFAERFVKLSSEKLEESGFEAPEWDFVCKDQWNEKLDGVYDPTKVVVHTILGAKREGIWVQRGREGVFRWKHREMVGTRQSTEEDSGQGPFAAKRLENKLEVIKAGRQQFEKQRAQCAVVKPDAIDALSMLELLQNTAGRPPAASETNASSSGDPFAAGASNNDGDDSDSSEAPTDRARNNLGSLFSLFNSASGHVSPGKKPQQSKQAIVAQSKQPKVVKNGDASPELEHEAALLDGRTRRLRGSLEAAADGIDKDIQALSFNEELRTGGDKVKKAALVDLFKQKTRRISKIEGSIANAMQRIKNSTSQSALFAVSNRLQALRQKVQQVSAFHSMAGTPAPAPEAFSEARKALSLLGITIGRSYFEFDLTLQGRQAMMRNDASALCQLCSADGPAMQQLVSSHAISREAQVSLAAGLVLDAVLDTSSMHATTQDAFYIYILCCLGHILVFQFLHANK